MKVLFTGTASSHCKAPSNTTFFGLLAKAVSEFAEVVWATPKLSWTERDLDEFDFIIFGLTPPTSLSANKIYGAMHLLGLMYSSPKLRLVVDSPQVWQYKNSIEAVKRDVDVLFKPFYSKKYGYYEAKTSTGKKYIELASTNLSTQAAPITYYPSLPWNSESKVSSVLGFIDESRLRGINLDSLVLAQEPYSPSEKSQRWAVEDMNRSWYTNLKPTLELDGVDVRASKALDDYSAGNLIRSSIGLIIPPQDRKTGTWWSYRCAQGLNSHTPIATLWQESTKLDPSWAYLPYQIEEMSAPQRVALAREQLESYQQAIQPKARIIEELRNDLLRFTKERI
jgi:hypothetical protein